MKNKFGHLPDEIIARRDNYFVQVSYDGEMYFVAHGSGISQSFRKPEDAIAHMDDLNRTASFPWQTVWPVEPGLWWFYGRRRMNDKNEFFLVNVVRGAAGQMTYGIQGANSWIDIDSSDGKWRKVDFPEKPKDMK